MYSYTLVNPLHHSPTQSYSINLSSNPFNHNQSYPINQFNITFLYWAIFVWFGVLDQWLLYVINNTSHCSFYIYYYIDHPHLLSPTMASLLTDEQVRTLGIIIHTSSTLSVVGSLFIIISFLAFKKIRKVWSPNYNPNNNNDRTFWIG